MIDLHIHTTYSDGTFTPEEILKKAENLDVKLLSITDHNSVDAYQDLKKAEVRNVFSGEIITGVEFATTLFGQVVEILGYGFDPEPVAKFIEEKYGNLEDYMRRELHMIYSTYEPLGVIFSKPESEFSVKEYGSAKRFVFGDLAREENKRFFGDVSNQTRFGGFIRREIYNPKSPLYMDYGKLLPSPAEIIEVIHRAGGLAFFAHCFIYTERIWGNLEEALDNLSVDGLEGWHPAFTSEQSAELMEFCNQKHLLLSGGSDYHGHSHQQLGNPQIDCSKVYEWAQRYY